jgi:hypothetical protein
MLTVKIPMLAVADESRVMDSMEKKEFCFGWLGDELLKATFFILVR